MWPFLRFAPKEFLRCHSRESGNPGPNQSSLDPKFRPHLLAHEEGESQQPQSERKTEYVPGQADAEHDRDTHEQPEWPVFNDASHRMVSF